MKKLLIITFIFTGCGATIDQQTADEINQKLRCVDVYSEEARRDREKMELEVRREIDEYSICKKVLKQLKDNKETLREESWDICSRGYATKRNTMVFRGR